MDHRRAQSSELAQAKVAQELHSRIQMGTALVITGGVWFAEDGHTCQVRASDGTFTAPMGTVRAQITPMPQSISASTARPGACISVPLNFCAQERSTRQRGRLAPEHALEQEEREEKGASPHVPAQYIVTIQGKPYVRYAGLLALAHQRGLMSLKARFISVTPDLALAEAEATFADGRVFARLQTARPPTVAPKCGNTIPVWPLCGARAALTRRARYRHVYRRGIRRDSMIAPPHIVQRFWAKVARCPMGTPV